MANHPIHPATVHFPIAFTVLAGALDAFYFASTHPTTAEPLLSALQTLDVQLAPSTFPILSYYATVLVLLTSVPAVLSGASELMPVIQRDGFKSAKAKTGVAHALINDIGAFGTAYNWWTRRGAIGFKPNGTNVLVSSALAIPASLIAAYLGGQLVYHYGMGIGIARSSKAKKTK